MLQNACRKRLQVHVGASLYNMAVFALMPLFVFCTLVRFPSCSPLFPAAVGGIRQTGGGCNWLIVMNELSVSCAQVLCVCACVCETAEEARLGAAS